MRRNHINAAIVKRALLLDLILLFMKSCTLVGSRINVAIVKRALLEHVILKITRECTLAKKHLNAGKKSQIEKHERMHTGEKSYNAVTAKKALLQDPTL